MLRALERFTFDNGPGGTVVIEEGSLVAASHPVVAEYPDAFEQLDLRSHVERGT
jgi:hypothetical protein